MSTTEPSASGDRAPVVVAVTDDRLMAAVEQQLAARGIAAPPLT